MELTIKEIDILIDALDAWESRDAAGNIMVDLLTRMAIPEGEDRDEAIKTVEENRANEELRKKTEKETSILIKAKLIQMKDKAMAGEASSFLKDPSA